MRVTGTRPPRDCGEGSRIPATDEWRAQIDSSISFQPHNVVVVDKHKQQTKYALALQLAGWMDGGVLKRKPHCTVSKEGL